MLVAVEDPDDDSGETEKHHDRKQDPRQIDCELSVAKSAHDPGRDDDEKRSHAAEPEQHEPEEARRYSPSTLAVTAFQQVAENRNKGRGQGRVRHESSDRVRD